VANTQPAQLSYSIVDALGTRASKIDYAMVDPATTVAQLITELQAEAALLDTIAGGQITSSALSLVHVPTGLKNAPGGQSRVEQTALFNFGNAVTSRRYGDAVPSFDSSRIVAGKIDLADQDVINYVTSLHTAWTLGAFTNASYQVLTGLVDAFISFRKRRQQLTRSSFEL
jgi:hypothetical protein